ncbi:unnamed protein product [Soboliphyme baturini]|uniref:Sulfide:quinone oxidoreductase, mitochondrial n=1 Tax=Soboliphyme baturini TaxID=241478 RepID=A0A183IV91_9BILA|nr:unnamed protein product [Soboliphyme baturini]
MVISIAFGQVKDLEEALKTDDVSSIYSPNLAEKTFNDLQRIQCGKLVFTFPITPIKCAGAPQKIVYLADDYLRKVGRRDQTTITYNTAMNVMFSHPKYSKVMEKVAKARGVHVNFLHNLVEVDYVQKRAIFDVLNTEQKKIGTKILPYDMLHVSPPCTAPEPLRSNKQLTAPNGWMNVDVQTLQHKTYQNIFGIGDCCNLPTSKTLAAITDQISIYHGYTACPLITSSKTVVMAEFGYNEALFETIPFDQGKERRFMFFLVNQVFPRLYWCLFIRS